MTGTIEFTEGSWVFVWNADGGWQQALLDGLHKIVSPRTYSCNLCQLTYGIARPRTRWTKFLEASGRRVEFYYRDQFNKTPLADEFPGLEFPVVLSFSSQKWQILLSKHEINQLKNLEELLQELRRRSSNME